MIGKGNGKRKENHKKRVLGGDPPSGGVFSTVVVGV